MLNKCKQGNNTMEPTKIICCTKGWSLSCLGFMAYQTFVGYLMPNTFLYK